MRLFRFHLSTLMIVCVFASAAIGLSFTPPAWEKVKDIQPYLQDYVAKTQWGSKARIFGGETIRLDSDPISGKKIALTFYAVDPATKKESPLYSIPRNGVCCQARFSKDGQFIATEGPGGPSEIFRRTRKYGWLGVIELPLFWVTLVSALGLCIVFVRWLGNLRASRGFVPIAIYAGSRQ